MDLYGRIIEVYGRATIFSLLLFVLIEIVAFLYIWKNRKYEIVVVKRIVIVSGFLLSIILFFAAMHNSDYHKVFTRGSVCSLEKTFDELKDGSSDELCEAMRLVYQEHYLKKYGEPMDGSEGYDETVMCDDSLVHSCRQTLLCLFVVLFGYAFSRATLKINESFLPLCLAAPMGVGIVVIIFILNLLVGFQLTRATLIVISTLMAVLLLACNHLRIKKISRYDIVSVILIALFSVGATIIKWFKFAGDCQIQLNNAVLYLKEGGLGTQFTEASTFGFLGTALHSVALLIGEDYFYSIYIVVSISVLGLMWISLKEFMGNEVRSFDAILIILPSLITLLLNFDYECYNIWILSNSSIAVYLCIIVICTFLAEIKDMDTSWIIVVASFSVIITRVEGVCYVLLFLLIPLCRVANLKKANILVGVEIIIWELAQALHYSGSIGGESWDIKKGLAFSTAALLLVLWQFVSEKDIIIVKWINHYYYLFYIIGLVGIILYAFCSDMGFSIETSKVFLSHLMVSRYSNSLGYFSFMIMLSPLLFINKSENLKQGLTFIIGYFLLVFGVALFRVNNPFHIQISDSLRRMIFQGMPFTTWVMVYLLLDGNYKRNTKE